MFLCTFSTKDLRMDKLYNPREFSTLSSQFLQKKGTKLSNKPQTLKRMAKKCKQSPQTRVAAFGPLARTGTVRPGPARGPSGPGRQGWQAGWEKNRWAWRVCSKQKSEILRKINF